MEINEGDYLNTLSDINESDEDNIIEDFNNLSVNEQNIFNNNLIKAFKSKEIKKTFISIFDSYFQSNKTNLKNANIGKLKRTSLLKSDSDDSDEDILEDVISYEKEKTNGEKNIVKIKKSEKKHRKISKNKNISKSVKKKNKKPACKYIFKDEDGNIKLYTFQRDSKDHYDLHCMDRNSKGKAKYIIETQKVVVNKKCTIENYNEHNYIKRKYIYNKIDKKEITEHDMNKKEYQKEYFKYMYINYPSLLYYIKNNLIYGKLHNFFIILFYYNLFQFN